MTCNDSAGPAPDWAEIGRQYLAGEVPILDIVAQHSISLTALYERRAAENWPKRSLTRRAAGHGAAPTCSEPIDPLPTAPPDAAALDRKSVV
jgi:hypothetical protein